MRLPDTLSLDLLQLRFLFFCPNGQVGDLSLFVFDEGYYLPSIENAYNFLLGFPIRKN